MSKEDNISKIFIENQKAFEQEPSSDLWDKIASTLDDQVHVQKKPKLFSLISRVAVAASFLLLVTVALVLQFNNPTVVSLNLDQQEAQKTTFDSLLEAFEADETLPVHLADRNQRLETEDELQEKVIVEAIQNSIVNNDAGSKKPDPISMDQIEIATSSNKLYEIDEVLNNGFSSEEEARPIPSMNNSIDDLVNDNKGNRIDEMNKVGYVLNDDIVSKDLQQKSNIVVEKQIAQNVQINTIETSQSSEDIRGFSNYATPSSISAFNSPKRNRLKKEREDFGDIDISTVESRSSRQSPIRFKTKEKISLSTPKVQVHPKLRPFTWLVGKWQDDHEKEGKSMEEWEVANFKTLLGKGFKYSMDNDLLFKEVFKIEYRSSIGQIFLRVKFIEGDKFIDYMLTSYDTDQVIFQQKEQMDYPDEVIIQRNLSGYTTIVTNKNSILLPDQQRYLENRHRVSNIRAIRTLRSASE